MIINVLYKSLIPINHVQFHGHISLLPNHSRWLIIEMKIVANKQQKQF